MYYNFNLFFILILPFTFHMSSATEVADIVLKLCLHYYLPGTINSTNLILR
jgi:hypothetical protein